MPTDFKSWTLKILVRKGNQAMTTLAELIKQKEALEVQITNTRQSELADAISKVKALVAEYGLTQKDVFGSSKRNHKSSIRKQLKNK